MFSSAGRAEADLSNSGTLQGNDEKVQVRERARERKNEHDFYLLMTLGQNGTLEKEQDARKREREGQSGESTETRGYI